MTGRPPAAETGPPPSRGLFRLRLRDARIRSKLGLILVIPLIAVIALAGVRLVDSSQRALSAELVRSLATVSAEASAVAHELHNERMLAASLLNDPDRDSAAFNIQAERTDEVIGRYRGARDDLGDVPDLIQDRLVRVDEQLRSLSELRQEILNDADVTASAVLVSYSVVLRDLISYQESVGQVTIDPELAESVRAVAALSKAKNQIGEAQATAYTMLLDGQPDEEQLTVFLGTLTGQQEALLAFTLAASSEQLTGVNQRITGSAMAVADAATSDVIRSVGGERRLTAEEASQALGAVVNLVRSEEIRLHDDQVALATQLRDDVYRQVLFESIAVLVALLFTVTVAVLLARMLARSLGRLRQHALAVADRELPETVARLSDPRTLGENTPAQLAAQVREPASLRSADEIGQVAQAFTVVHRAAVRVAAEQAALRTSVSAMFLNLARRSQSLVDRMISQLDEIERHEEDPKRLARMFTLDHLATRMRRNDENLLTLAGADSSPPRTEDALVADALRAAQSEVEHYDRIEFGTVDTDVSVAAGAVNDVVRLVAELFDNATRFSPPDAPVVCEARRLGDQVIIQIEDRGVGMSPEQVDRVNAWLASPPAVEVTTFRKMGLAVVARLANRHGIRVELRCDPNFGTVAYIALPRTILILPPSRMRYAEITPPRSTTPPELPAATPAPAAPPVPSRHLGQQLPRRSPAVVHHAANRRGQEARENSINSHATDVELPVAGRGLYELGTDHAGSGSTAPTTSAPTTTTVPEATVELPIFKEMEAVWFRSHGSLDLGRDVEAPRAGAYPMPQAGPSPATGGGGTPPVRPETPVADAHGYGGAAVTAEWRTAADSGWRAAAAAAQPRTAGSTRSGLPKRVPQAQLVPGSVDSTSTTANPPNQRRSPEEVRGLLAAYHRGVQRGRESGGGR